MISQTPEPPCYAVIFTSVKQNDEGYSTMAERMKALAAEQEGYPGMECTRNEIGITVSYWSSLEAIRQWKTNLEHLEAQRLGKTFWYSDYRIRICRVEREYGKEEG
jgi:heme-degrading monooxygenase HmoA